ncbi:MAG TPA: hypothetical protein VER14_04545 [Phototrophicaceae bacterium]|nr:hypothetical protein [Phototrophicaceae bacterium]
MGKVVDCHYVRDVIDVIGFHTVVLFLIDIPILATANVGFFDETTAHITLKSLTFMTD